MYISHTKYVVLYTFNVCNKYTTFKLHRKRFEEKKKKTVYVSDSSVILKQGHGHRTLYELMYPKKRITIQTLKDLS